MSKRITPTQLQNSGQMIQMLAEHTTLDAGQLDAFVHTLCRDIAITQGPPGVCVDVGYVQKISFWFEMAGSFQIKTFFPLGLGDLCFFIDSRSRIWNAFRDRLFFA